MMRFALLALCVTGCSAIDDFGRFSVTPSSSPDLGSDEDLAQAPDLGSDEDLAQAPDLGSDEDLAQAPDLGSDEDLAQTPDAGFPGDLTQALDLRSVDDLLKTPDLNSPPDLAKPCAGWRGVNGACWYVAPLAVSCLSFCQTHGGFDSVGSTHVGGAVCEHFYSAQEIGPPPAKPNNEAIEFCSLASDRLFGPVYYAANGMQPKGTEFHADTHSACACKE